MKAYICVQLGELNPSCDTCAGEYMCPHSILNQWDTGFWEQLTQFSPVMTDELEREHPYNEGRESTVWVESIGEFEVLIDLDKDEDEYYNPSEHYNPFTEEPGM